MASPSSLLAELRAAGLSLRRQGQSIMVSPIALLSDDHKQAILGSRTGLLEILDWEEVTGLLAELDPDWRQGAVQLLDAVILRWPDGANAGACTALEMASLDRWRQLAAHAAQDRRQARKRKPTRKKPLPGQGLLGEKP